MTTTTTDQPAGNAHDLCSVISKAQTALDRNEWREALMFLLRYQLDVAPGSDSNTCLLNHPLFNGTFQRALEQGATSLHVMPRIYGRGAVHQGQAAPRLTAKRILRLLKQFKAHVPPIHVIQDWLLQLGAILWLIDQLMRQHVWIRTV